MTESEKNVSAQLKKQARKLADAIEAANDAVDHGGIGNFIGSLWTPIALRELNDIADGKRIKGSDIVLTTLAELLSHPDYKLVRSSGYYDPEDFSRNTAQRIKRHMHIRGLMIEAVESGLGVAGWDLTQGPKKGRKTVGKHTAAEATREDSERGPSDGGRSQ